jgi:hypothetical protein
VNFFSANSFPLSPSVHNSLILDRVGLSFFLPLFVRLICARAQKKAGPVAVWLPASRPPLARAQKQGLIFLPYPAIFEQVIIEFKGNYKRIVLKEIMRGYNGVIKCFNEG